jgi:hypothetical protein
MVVFGVGVHTFQRNLLIRDGGRIGWSHVPTQGWYSKFGPSQWFNFLVGDVYWKAIKSELL